MKNIEIKKTLGLAPRHTRGVPVRQHHHALRQALGGCFIFFPYFMRGSEGRRQQLASRDNQGQGGAASRPGARQQRAAGGSRVTISDFDGIQIGNC